MTLDGTAFTLVRLHSMWWAASCSSRNLKGLMYISERGVSMTPRQNRPQNQTSITKVNMRISLHFVTAPLNYFSQFHAKQVFNSHVRHNVRNDTKCKRPKCMRASILITFKILISTFTLEIFLRRTILQSMDYPITQVRLRLFMLRMSNEQHCSVRTSK